MQICSARINKNRRQSAFGFTMKILILSVAFWAFLAELSYAYQFVFPTTQPEKTPCQRCTEWYNRERTDLRWLRALNKQIKCPCSIAMDRHGFPIIPQGWSEDPTCYSHHRPYCHQGAYSCIRSVLDKSSFKIYEFNVFAGQQCCYTSNGVNSEYEFNTLTWIRSGEPAAGTPDKVAKITGEDGEILGAKTAKLHNKDDLATYEDCCRRCGHKHCNYYIKGVRKGPDTCSRDLSDFFLTDLLGS